MNWFKKRKQIRQLKSDLVMYRQMAKTLINSCYGHIKSDGGKYGRWVSKRLQVIGYQVEFTNGKLNQLGGSK